MKVLKFGGSSIRTPDRILEALEIIKASNRDGDPAVVVVSAFGGVTDRLIEMSTLASKRDKRYKDVLRSLERRHFDCIEELILGDHQTQVTSKVKDLIHELNDLLRGVSLVTELPSRTMDQILSLGERLSSIIITESLKSHGMDAQTLDARNIIKTDRTFGSARIDMQKTFGNIRQYFRTPKAIQIVTGFIGSTEEDETTTLGRSGSDYTASIIGAALRAEAVEIWTDVHGIMTADPRKVPDAVTIESMTYEEAMEMSHFGAKVIFPPALQPAMSHGIPIRIRNTFHPEFGGTVIKAKVKEKDRVVTGISSIHDIALLRVQGSGMIGVAGIAERLFRVLANEQISVFLITQASSAHSICLAIKPDIANLAKGVIEKEFSLEIEAKVIDKVKIERNLSTVAVVGENMRHTPGIAGKVFDALGESAINVVAIAQGSSERNISIVIDRRDETRALRVLHRAFFDSHRRTIELFVIGTGRVGGELLRLMERSHHPVVSIHLMGLASSRKMTFDPEGIPLDAWESRLSNSASSMELSEFIHRMVENKSAHAIFVDCTASNQVADRYREILSHRFSIVTCNKIANTRSWDEFVGLRETARHHGVRFSYETNVGGGLPVINTLKGLVNSGDKILKIEGVLSGTLSYLFNSFTGEKPFSEMVQLARSLGYTEPDPREDLGGMDVARKLLILAREIGLQLELDDIEVESLLPEGSSEADSIEDFLALVRLVDENFERRRSESKKKEKKLCYMASLENGVGKVALRAVGKEHPFSSLTGRENMIAFTTKRYSDNPLIIRGVGAGPSVTAAGVYADILNLAD